MACNKLHKCQQPERFVESENMEPLYDVVVPTPLKVDERVVGLLIRNNFR